MSECGNGDPEYPTAAEIVAEEEYDQARYNADMNEYDVGGR